MWEHCPQPMHCAMQGTTTTLIAPHRFALSAHQTHTHHHQGSSTAQLVQLTAQVLLAAQDVCALEGIIN